MNDEQKQNTVSNKHEQQDDQDLERRMEDQAAESVDQDEQQDGELDTRTNKGRTYGQP